MSSAAAIALVAVLAGAACALCGVFLVLRRGAMVADAVSHSVLPGLLLGYLVANGPNVLVGLLFATAAGLAAVLLIEALARTRTVHSDTATGLVFPAFFALGVFVISTSFANVHIDTDAVLYGEIATAPFDTLVVGGRDLGPTAVWLLGGLLGLNAAVLALLYPRLKLATFDPDHAASIGLRPARVHVGLMALVAVTTVGAFSAVGAVLAVALVVTPPVVASMLTRRLPWLVGISLAVGAGGGLLGYGAAAWLDVSISGMVAAVLGGFFLAALVAAPESGLLAQRQRRRRQQAAFAVDMLLMHLATHAGTPAEPVENTLLHVEQELGWPAPEAATVAARAARDGLLRSQGGTLSLTEAGYDAASRLRAEVGAG